MSVQMENGLPRLEVESRHFRQNALKLDTRELKFPWNHVNFETLRQVLAPAFYQSVSAKTRIYSTVLFGREYTLPFWAVCSTENLKMVSLCQYFAEHDAHQLCTKLGKSPLNPVACLQLAACIAFCNHMSIWRIVSRQCIADRDPVCQKDRSGQRRFLGLRLSLWGLTFREGIEATLDTPYEVCGVFTTFAFGRLCHRDPSVHKCLAADLIWRICPRFEKGQQLLICNAHQIGREHLFQQFISHEGSGCKDRFGFSQYEILAFLTNVLHLKFICTLENGPNILHIHVVLQPMKRVRVNTPQMCRIAVQNCPNDDVLKIS